MFSLFKKASEEIVAVFDIGNGSIGGALVKLRRNAAPVLLYTHREPLTFAEKQTSENLISSMMRLLTGVAEHLVKDGLSHVKTSPFGTHRLQDAYCIFASPWCISQTRVVRDEWEKQTSISKGTIEALIKKDQDAFNQALKEGKYDHIFGQDDRLLEKEIINVKLNGYSVHEPFGKKARELELTLFTSYIAKDIPRKVEDTIRRAFYVRHFHYLSYGFVSWGASQTLYPDVHDYFFIDVSAETTDISLIVRDILIETVSFPMGRSTIMRKLVRDLNVTPEVATSYISMYFAGTLDTTFKQRLTAIMSAVEVDWYDALVTALEKFQKIYSLPRASFVTADLDTSKLFLKALSRELPTELNVAKNTLAVTYITPDKVQHDVELLPGVVQDPFLALESILINKTFSHRY